MLPTPGPLHTLLLQGGLCALLSARKISAHESHPRCDATCDEPSSSSCAKLATSTLYCHMIFHTQMFFRTHDIFTVTLLRRLFAFVISVTPGCTRLCETERNSNNTGRMTTGLGKDKTYFQMWSYSAVLKVRTSKYTFWGTQFNP